MAIVAVCQLAILKRMPVSSDSVLRHQENSTLGGQQVASQVQRSGKMKTYSCRVVPAEPGIQ